MGCNPTLAEGKTLFDWTAIFSGEVVGPAARMGPDELPRRERPARRTVDLDADS